MKEKIIQCVTELLERYPETVRKIALLRYELEHPSIVTPDEMIDAMSFARGEGGSAKQGHISNKTLYIAMNYQTETARENRALMDEIVRRLVPLEREIKKLEHHLSLLSERDSRLLRLRYLEEASWERITEETGLARRTAHTALKIAVDRLAEMYAFISDDE